jgi:hypothetical protein
VRASRVPFLLVALLVALPAAAADVRRVEAVGAVGLDPDGGWTTPPRDAALRRALFEAVAQVAWTEAPDLDPEESEDVLQSALGDDPFVYSTRYRILEDRGERRALLIQDPDVEREYVVVVEAYVDADRVRERLARAGLRAPPAGDRETARFDVVVVGLDSYDVYAAVRTALVEGAGADSATPVELSRGRAVFAVEAADEPPAFLEALVARSGPQLTLVPLEADDETLVLRVELRDLSGEPAAEAPEAFDTPGRNRY